MCQRIGRPPTSTIGFGRTVVSSASREPSPPANITTFIWKLSDGPSSALQTIISLANSTLQQVLHFSELRTTGIALWRVPGNRSKGVHGRRTQGAADLTGR